MGHQIACTQSKMMNRFYYGRAKSKTNVQSSIYNSTWWLCACVVKTVRDCDKKRTNTHETKQKIIIKKKQFFFDCAHHGVCRLMWMWVIIIITISTSFSLLPFSFVLRKTFFFFCQRNVYRVSVDAFRRISA